MIRRPYNDVVRGGQGPTGGAAPQNRGGTIGGRPVPPRTDTTGRGPGFARDPRSGAVHSGGWHFDKSKWQWAPKPGLYDNSSPPNAPRTTRLEAEMTRLGMDPNNREHRMRFQASLNPEYASWLSRARPDMDLQFNTNLEGIDPAIRDRIIDRGQDALTRARILEALNRGNVQPTGGPATGTVPQLPPGSVAPATPGDVFGQRRQARTDMGLGRAGTPSELLGGPAPGTPPGGAAPGGRPTLTPEQTQHIIDRTRAFGFAEIGGRKYQLNQYGAVVDVTNPNGRFRITDRTGKVM